MLTFDEHEKPDFNVDMADAVLNLETRVIDSKKRTNIKRADFEIAGDTMTVQHRDPPGNAHRQCSHDDFQPEGTCRHRRETMKRDFAAAFLFTIASAARSAGQDAAATPADPARRPKPGLTGARRDRYNGQPITTQIYADEASFDTEKRIGVFTGHVRVFDPRFNIQSDKLTVFIHKEEGEGLEKAIAEGNVGVVRDKPDPKGGPPSKAVGLSEKAVYTSSDGNVELTGSPRVQQGLDTHVATSPDTVMVLNQNGHLTTHGPSRTEIRQKPRTIRAQPSPAPTAVASPAKKP